MKVLAAGPRQERRTVATVGVNKRFLGKVAVVTGSTADPSIGRSCALRLARDGASVVINGRDPSRLAATEAALRGQGLDVIGVVGSMGTQPAAAVLVARAVEAFGGIDMIVSTLGGAPYPCRSRPSVRPRWQRP